MRIFDRLHALHRFWRYRLRTEREELAFMLSRDLNGGTVVDAGANRGCYSYWMHKAVGPQGNVVAFEPQPELTKYLHDLRSSFRLNRLTIVPAGLSSHPERTNLIRPKTHWGGASLHIQATESTDRIPIALTTLDDYFVNSALRPIRFIKADVQGHELEMFLGGERILREDRPELLFEGRDQLINDGLLVNFLEELAYDGFFDFEGQLTPISRFPELRTHLSRRVNFSTFYFLPRQMPQHQLSRAA